MQLEIATTDLVLLGTFTHNNNNNDDDDDANTIVPLWTILGRSVLAP
jgi:hypothetical protein